MSGNLSSSNPITAISWGKIQRSQLRGLKKYNPVTPSLRHRLILSREHLDTGIRSGSLSKKFYKRQLIKGLHKNSGRNNQGRITSFRKGGGHKKCYRKIDFLKEKNLYGVAEVLNIEYNPHSNNNVALLKSIAATAPGGSLTGTSCRAKPGVENKYFYILAPENLQVGDKIKGIFHDQIVEFFPLVGPHSESHTLAAAVAGLRPAPSPRPAGLRQASILQAADRASPGMLSRRSPASRGIRQVGEIKYLKDIPVGSFIHSVELYPGSGGKIARAAGTYCVLLKTLDNDITLIKLPSNKIIELNCYCKANIGQVSNSSFRSIVLGKAGASR